MTDQQPGQADETAPEAKKYLRLYLLIAFFGTIALNDLLLLRNGGGIMSAVAAVRRAEANAAAILIADDALLTIFVGVLCLVLLLIARVVVFELHHKGATTVIIFGLMIGAYLLNSVLGYRIISHYMIAHGYSRCETLDTKIGKRRGQVWLDGYVRAGAHCPAK